MLDLNALTLLIFFLFFWCLFLDHLEILIYIYQFSLFMSLNVTYSFYLKVFSPITFFARKKMVHWCCENKNKINIIH